MPSLNMIISNDITLEKCKKLVSDMSIIVSKCIGKPEKYVMVSVQGAEFSMSREKGNSAFVDIRSIGGLNANVNRRISQEVCALIEESVGIPAERVYLNFTDIPAGNWGWNGSTFG